MKQIISAALVALLTVVAVAANRQYFNVSISKLSSGQVKFTHVQIEGVVTYVRHQEDGDWHVKVCDNGTPRACVITESVPELPMPVPKVGARVSVQGITRYDKEHGLWEVHPVEQLKEIK